MKQAIELSDTSFINSKRIRYLGDLIRELSSVIQEFYEVIAKEKGV